ncbi:MAG: 4Fe-4S binding protein [Candidatus Caldarchaeum sp.]|nr:4Fe-4S binding protein [Candidatus Caldarchaeum sp.]MDW7978088.1 4Fe-4S binding protein [Candidatus Caldarchaeum sp.]MDW8360554.1 4Fe-4S binding protein [Candidatus Caldarchaeum sp.]
MVLDSIARIVKPMTVAFKHMFSTPVTVKYPYEKIVNTTGEYYRYDPKAGIAYPGFKGRHILYLDKCTGCSLCDIACQNIAEAIIMVYGFNITLKLSKEFMESFKKGEKTAVDFVEKLTETLYMPRREDRVNSHPVPDVAWTDFRAIQAVEDGYVWKLNAEPVYAYRSEAVVESYLHNFMRWLKTAGWVDEVVEVQGADKEDEHHMISREGHKIILSIVKIDEKLAHNKKSYFPAVDYSRCVFCGLCVDACPFYALEMMPDYEIAAMDRRSLLYSPKALAKPGVSTAPAEIGWFDKLVMALRGW